jgi:hypothetical protein
MDFFFLSGLLLTNFLPPILFIEELFSDMTLVLKIFVLLTIISYVTQHLGKGPLALMLIAILSWFIIFDYFMVLGGIYFLFMVLVLGGTQILMDMFILAPQAAMEQQMSGEVANQPNGADFQDRQRRMLEMKKRAGMM